VANRETGQPEKAFRCESMCVQAEEHKSSFVHGTADAKLKFKASYDERKCTKYRLHQGGMKKILHDR
jgi:hypothetical protein